MGWFCVRERIIDDSPYVTKAGLDGVKRHDIFTTEQTELMWMIQLLFFTLFGGLFFVHVCDSTTSKQNTRRFALDHEAMCPGDGGCFLCNVLRRNA